jgi:prolyl-tRNA synthetase
VRAANHQKGDSNSRGSGFRMRTRLLRFLKDSTRTFNIKPANNVHMADNNVEEKLEKLNVEGNAASAAPKKEKAKKQDKERKDQKVANKAAKPQQQAKKKADGPVLVGITESKAGDLSEWYQQVILKGELLEFTDVPGCYIYLPASYSIWEMIQGYFNERIKKMGVKNTYFPLFTT